MRNKYYAHSRDGKPPEDWHRLEDHLNEVAEKARVFANEFNAGDWGYLDRLMASLWTTTMLTLAYKEFYDGANG